MKKLTHQQITHLTSLVFPTLQAKRVVLKTSEGVEVMFAASWGRAGHPPEPMDPVTGESVFKYNGQGRSPLVSAANSLEQEAHAWHRGILEEIPISDKELVIQFLEEEANAVAFRKPDLVSGMLMAMMARDERKAFARH